MATAPLLRRASAGACPVCYTPVVLISRSIATLSSGQLSLVVLRKAYDFDLILGCGPEICARLENLLDSWIGVLFEMGSAITSSIDVQRDMKAFTIKNRLISTLPQIPCQF